MRLPWNHPPSYRLAYPPEFLDQGKAGSWGRLSKNRLSARKACSAAIAGCDERSIPVRQAGKKATRLAQSQWLVY